MRSKTNKFLGILLALAMLMTSVLPSFAALAAGAAEVTFVSSATDALKPGDTFTVTPTIANNPGFAGATWKLEYDNTALELTQITADGRKAGHLFGYGTFVSNLEYGENNLVYANATPETENGALCELTFKVREGAANRDYTVNVAKSDAEFKFVALNSVNVDVNFTAASVKVESASTDYTNAKLSVRLGKGTEEDPYTYKAVGDETVYLNANGSTGGNAWNGGNSAGFFVVLNGEPIEGVTWALENNNSVMDNMNPSFYVNGYCVRASGNGGKIGPNTLTATLPDGSTQTAKLESVYLARKIAVSSLEGADKFRAEIKTSSKIDPNTVKYVGAEGDSFTIVKDLYPTTKSAKLTDAQAATNPVSYRSSDENVATVDNTGKVTLTGDGIVTIEVVIRISLGMQEAEELTAPITVYSGNYAADYNWYQNGKKLARDYDLNKNGQYVYTQATVYQDRETEFTVKPIPESAPLKIVSATAKNSSAVEVTVKDDTTLIVKGLTAGDALQQISVSFDRASGEFQPTSSFGSLYLTIKAPSGVESVSLDQASMNLVLCDGFNTGKLVATVNPETVDQSVVWTSSNEEVATVAADGTVTAVAVGTAKITATSAEDETKFAECEVTVTEEVPLTSVSWSIDVANSEIARVNANSSAYVYVADPAQDTGKKIVMKASYKPENATNKTLKAVEWSLKAAKGVNADDIATIDEYGTVTWKGGFGKLELNGKGLYNGKVTTKVQTLHFTPGLSTEAKVLKDGAEVNDVIVVKPGDSITFNAGWTVSNEAYTPEYQWVYLKDASNNNSFTNLTANGDLVITPEKLEKWGVADGGTLTLQLRVAIYQSAIKNATSDSDTVKKNFVVKYQKTTPVESVTLDQSAVALNIGETKTLTATVAPAEADQTVVWSSSNDAVATVENGVVTAIAAGTAKITAKSAADETKLAECEVTVEAAPDYSNAYLAYCKGSKNAYEFIPVGDTLYINNSANNNNYIQEYRIAVVNNGEIVADMPNEKWEVENKANVFMNAYHDSTDPDGVFYINAHGKAEGATGKITATLPDGSTRSTNVVVTLTPSDLSITGVEGLARSRYNSKTAFLAIGDAFKFTYTYKVSSNKVTPVNTQYRYESADPSVATVAADGTITAVAAGNTTITVYAMTYHYGVETPVALKTTLPVYVDPDYAEYVALFDAEGNMKGEYGKNSYGSTTVTITLNAGEEITLWAKGMPGESELTYASTRDNQFKINSGSGVTVTNNADGSFTLKADDVTEQATAVVRSGGFYRSAAYKKANSSFDTTVVVNPAPAVESVSLNQSALELKEGGIATLTATVAPEGANQSVVWTTSNADVATVENGVVTAIAAGTAKITATSAKDETKFAECEVTVTSAKSIAIEKNYDDSSASNFPKAEGRNGVDITKYVVVTTEPAGAEYEVKVDLDGIKNNAIREAMRYNAETHMLSIHNTYGIISNIPVVATLKDDPTVTASTMISVNFVKVTITGLTLTDANGNTEGTYKVGDEAVLTAVYTPANTSYQDTTWTTTNASVATVEMLTDPTGSSTAKVTIVGEGEAIIKARPTTNIYSEGAKMTQEYKITVPVTPKLEGLTALLGCEQATVNVGDEIDVKLYVNSDNAEEIYNAFKFGVNFSENLEYLGFTGLDTENDYNFVDASGNTVTVSGFGASKTVSGENALVTLRFKATGAGEAKITLPEDAAFANEKGVAVSENLKAIKVMNGEITVNVKKTFEIPVTGGTVDGGKTTIPATEGESATFTPDQPEDGTVIDKVLVDGKEVAPNPDGSYTIPNPTENTTVEIVTSKKVYNVTFTGNGAADANGAKTATHGEAYTFTISKDSDYNYSVTATIGGKDVALTGEYTIAGADVTGDITIVITKTEKSEEETMRNVTAYLNDSTEGTAMTKVAKNAQSYVFSNPYAQTAKAIRATVKGTEVTITENADGTWTIPGTFAGDVEIFFAGVYNVTKPEAITGEATAEYLKDYTFTVPAAYASGKPTVTIGGETYALADGTTDETGNVVYTISGNAIKGDIVITLPDPTALVEVGLYFKAEDANGAARNVYIVTAKPNLPMPAGKVFAYNGEAMFWSEEYQAYAYLVSTGEALTAETATAQVALAEGEQKTIDYSGDVNMSGTVDLNDAQLVYDLYNASYYDFSTVSMEKMLRADVSKDKKIDVSDVTAIVAIVRK